MTSRQTDTIEDLLISNIPRELILSIEDALTAGSQRAIKAAEGSNSGHRASVLGHMRHFRMNEAFHMSLEIGGACPTPLQGNKVIQGQSGIFALARFNISQGIWNSGRRSKKRKQLAEANKVLARLKYLDLFEEPTTPTSGTVFFVSTFARRVDEINSIYVAVPDEHMEGWLFKEPIGLFAKRYDTVTIDQTDMAIPTLKASIKRKTSNESEK